jgi:hypothetical protein
LTSRRDRSTKARAFDLNADHPIIRIEIQRDPGGHFFRNHRSFVGGAFAPNLPSSMRQGLLRKPLRQLPASGFSMTQGSRLKPLLRKDGFCRRGFRPELPAFDGAGVAVKAVPATPSSWFSMTQGSRLKPLLRKDGFCRRGFRPEPPAFDGARVAMKAAPITPSLWFFDDARVAAKAAPTTKRGRGGSRSYKGLWL